MIHKSLNHKNTLILTVTGEQKYNWQRIIPTEDDTITDDAVAERILSATAVPDRDQIYRLLTQVHVPKVRKYELPIVSSARYSESTEPVVASFTLENNVLSLSLGSLTSFPIARRGSNFVYSANVNTAAIKEMCKVTTGVFLVGVLLAEGEFPDIWYLRQFTYGETIIII